MPAWLRLLRPYQYTKNILVFAAPVAAGRIADARTFGLTCAAFGVFCIVASAGYVTNDLLDIEADRRHPRKRFRPLASGEISAHAAKGLLLCLTTAALVTALALGWGFFLVIVLYATISGCYSRYIKNVPWVELASVSSGFVLRAVAGAFATSTPLSTWFVLVVSFGALLLIVGKRLGELLAGGVDRRTRAVLVHYRLGRLRMASVVAAVGTIGGYLAWSISEAVHRANGSFGVGLLRSTLIPFAVAVSRYLTLSWNGVGEAPEVLIFKDRVVVGAGFLWMLLYASGLYV